MVPIPKKMLPHSAELTTYYGADKWGNSLTGDTVQLEHVYIEPSFSTAADTSGVEIKLSARLFFDSVNSLPKGKPFHVAGDTVNGQTVSRQEVAFEGRTYLVKTVSEYYDTKKLHHFEVGLI